MYILPKLKWISTLENFDSVSIITIISQEGCLACAEGQSLSAEDGPWEYASLFPVLLLFLWFLHITMMQQEKHWAHVTSYNPALLGSANTKIWIQIEGGRSFGYLEALPSYFPFFYF